MKTVIKILRVLPIIALLAIIGLPVSFYLLLSTDWAQERLCNAGQEILTNLLGTEVTVGSINYAPFNRIVVNNIRVEDDQADGALWISKLEGRVEFIDLIKDQKLIIDYVVIDGLTARLTRGDASSPLNIQGIIDRFKNKEKKESSSRVHLSINDFQLTNSQVSYDVLDAEPTPGRFNSNHILLTEIDCEVYVPVLTNDTYKVELNQLSAYEQSGLRLKNLLAHAEFSPYGAEVSQLQVELPNSLISFTPLAVEGDWQSKLPKLGTQLPVGVGIRNGSHVYLPDLAPIVPKLADISQYVDLSVFVEGVVDSLDVSYLALSAEASQLSLHGKGKVYDITDSKQTRLENIETELRCTNNDYILQLLSDLGLKSSPLLTQALEACAEPVVTLAYDGTLRRGKGTISLESDAGNVSAEGAFMLAGKNCEIDAAAALENFDLGTVLGAHDLGYCTANVEAKGNLGKLIDGEAELNVDHLHFRGYDYQDLKLKLTAEDNSYVVNLKSDDPNARLSLYGHANLGEAKSAEMVARLFAVNLDTLNLYNKYPGYRISGNIQAKGEGQSLARFKADARITNLHYVNDEGSGLSVSKIVADADNTDGLGEINIDCDFLHGSVQGQYNFASIGQSVDLLMAEVFPSYADNVNRARHSDEDIESLGNNFNFDFTVSDAENVCQFFGLPVSILDPVNINGELCDAEHRANVNVDAPWLIQGNNLVESTNVSVQLDGLQQTGIVYATTHYPTQKGPMDMTATINAEHDKLATNVDWQIVRDNPINGNIKFDTSIYKDEARKLCVDVAFQPGLINFGNEVWNIRPSHIFYQDKFLNVDHFALEAPTQSVIINGTASQYPQDRLKVKLNGIQLLDIFETLNIDKALICGNATGTLLVSELFAKTPNIESTDFFVKDMGYNGCVLGDGDIKITYDAPKAAFCFDAVLDQADGRQSKIKGSIIPAEEYLDFDFDADHVKVGFLKPFMDAFCSDIEGYASGKAHLYGTFKYIDLAGDIMADTVRLKIDFTNTWYSASDSLRIRPGVIDLNNITIYDEQNHPAKLNGWVKHYYFHQPSFDFAITGAKNFLSYNITKADNPRWYGTIYGNGSAHVTGEPGVVNIGVAMSTAPKSTFTFELLDDEEAAEYSFIVFNDVTPVVIGDAYTDVKYSSKAVEKAKSMKRLEEEDEPTDYRMDIKVDITPQAQVNIVMDPIGGDCIHAYGSGQMAMTYDSTDEDLRLMGTYTLEKGDYNFTLQDILIKNFTIRQGSSITFTGDPYQAQLDINAIYSVNANLSDLDESFLQDKDLNRTNVPVYAVMKVTGNMLQPDIAFDLEFPTLTSDIYRKVRSIVSTDDMMNRQIIYLLALNRFYTPEYMASTTKGNELFSVASATISSQLSSMLGKLSDNWSIAPNLRSDRGDFSDIEVDLTLSSSLLNNRLLFNGNFGYRDKSLNQNQFIGDFDIEYLLNRSGNIRLKAYNRYNDQNYYLRTATTTQGVGVVWHRDFDNIFGFLRPKKKTKN
ncbi:MAG: translocation/assembly module TamB domain-containing protein [Bacteroidales bacterium]|nr:translocation/assembly module TamB domain-containing protein [Bacteroidales bacterium]